MANNAAKAIEEAKRKIAQRKARATQLAKDTEAERKVRSIFAPGDSRKFAAASTKAERSWNGTGSTTSGKFLTGPLKPGESRTYDRARAKAKK